MKNDEQQLPPLREIYFYVTHGCNLKCRHCWVAAKFTVDASANTNINPDVFKCVISEAKPLGLAGVKFTGGEPLLLPSLPWMINLARSYHLKVTIETNGMLITPDFINRAKVAPDLSFAISLDGATSDVHDKIRGVRGAFAATVKGIQRLVKVGVYPQLIMTLMRSNVKQLDDFVSLAENIGASSVGINILQPIERGERLYKQNMALPIEELVSIGQYVENELLSKARIPIYYGHPPAFRPLHNLFDSENGGLSSCGIKTTIGVLPDSTYALCGIGINKPEFVLGKVCEDALENVWSTNALLHEIRTGLPERLGGVCKLCTMKNVCLGKCVVQNIIQGKDNLWQSFWYCQKAYDNGLFPKSRLIG